MGVPFTWRLWFYPPRNDWHTRVKSSNLGNHCFAQVDGIKDSKNIPLKFHPKTKQKKTPYTPSKTFWMSPPPPKKGPCVKKKGTSSEPTKFKPSQFFRKAFVRLQFTTDPTGATSTVLGCPVGWKWGSKVNRSVAYFTPNISHLWVYTPCKFNIAPENIPSPKVVFQPSFFRGYVKLRVCRWNN